ncbi:hypothetical protein TVAG_032140 [Trichomonas vaginalis G3]|uniref:Sphingomyelin synthase-like domain-containing protein n=1 Tax=Trichomonas vaginalis (strain ATCC PRA-98 / G3) TaxID=412133 RepID=A2FIE9_TRIV3|nr:sphingomyelin synthase protein [Trichomonas vaginalis G3]EAX95311.1 hypothetical protein TVAG_032140 [Trichomonas vaginalis G3]KAI5500578.1 sphingomyelin synthase protein [Trichomonas vaginalis G3]|eukprot:XP_001308241.1 hypothetical protein [Trichomonas vaginalis G3]
MMLLPVVGAGVDEQNQPLQGDDERPLTRYEKLSKYSNIWKTLLTIGFLVIVHTFTGIALVITNAKRPAVELLPDAIQSAIPYVKLEIYINILMVLMIVSEVIFIIFNKKRWYIIRRTVAVYAILSLIRVFTMTVTFLPDPSPKCPREHDPNYKITFKNIITQLFGGLTCGDMIFSGHTMGFIFPGLIHHHFIGKIIGWIYLFVGVIGAFGLIVSRFHYTVDVLLSLVLSPLLYFAYNLCCENPTLANKLPCLLSKYFMFMEWSEMAKEEDNREKL